MRTRTKILIGVGVAAGGTLAVLAAAGWRLARRFEPYVKEQTQLYLSKRFDSEVEIGALRLRAPKLPPIRLFLTKGRGVIAEAEGENIVLRHRGRRDIPPMFAIRRLSFEVDLGRLFEPKKRVALIHLEGMKIVIPPKGERPQFSKEPAAAPAASGGKDEESLIPVEMAPEARNFLIERVVITDSELVILPRNRSRQPLEFALHRVALSSIQTEEAMEYEAQLTNPKPPGLIRSRGTFGPWNTETPSDTRHAGTYEFESADLSVFRVISGTLQSTGKFGGKLGEIKARGEVRVPDFQLRKAGHPVPLTAQFEAVVDGTDGDTILQPVRARLNQTEFVTSGAVIKHDGDTRRSIDLRVNMPAGQMTDVLTLAMKAPPPMSGRIKMNALIRVPPLAGKVVEKLLLDGSFQIDEGQFKKSEVQDKVDQLSRRAQGQPKNEAIDDVFSQMAGKFRMADQSVHFDTVTFRVPGAAVELSGDYDLDDDKMDLAGSLKLDAKVSQTMSGWKRWVLKPVDPVFARKGAGTFLKIKVAGSSKSPQFSAGR